MPVKKPPGLSIDINITNGGYNSIEEDDQGLITTYRAEGLSIGRNYLRFQGNYISHFQSLEDFIELGIIGRGISSVVKKAKLNNTEDGYGKMQFYALKVLSLGNPANQNIHFPAIDGQKDEEVEMKQSSMLIQELKMLCQLDCECLIPLVGAFYEPGVSVTMVLEYMDCGSISDFLDSLPRNGSKRFSEEAVISIAYQILNALEYLHGEHILHRDIKPANVLLDTSGSVKLSDLGLSGLARYARRDQDQLENTSGLNHTICGTSLYLSPERLRDKAYGSPSDIWAFGLVVLECATGGWNPLIHGSKFGNFPKKHRRSRSIIDLAVILEDFDVENMFFELQQADTDTVIDWKLESERENGIGEIIRFSLQKMPDKRIPAKLLLKSPCFEEYYIDSIDAAHLVMQEFLTSVEATRKCI
jgi:serine/threonine protein kinase